MMSESKKDFTNITKNVRNLLSVSAFLHNHTIWLVGFWDITINECFLVLRNVFFIVGRLSDFSVFLFSLGEYVRYYINSILSSLLNIF